MTGAVAFLESAYITETLLLLIQNGEMTVCMCAVYEILIRFIMAIPVHLLVVNY